MRTIRTSRFINFTDDGKSIERVELDVDTIDELPDGELNGVILAHGSIAHIVSTGEFYALGGDGKWYNQDDGSTPSDEVTASPNMVSPTVIRPQTQLNTVQFDPEDDDIEEVSADAENERGVESE